MYSLNTGEPYRVAQSVPEPLSATRKVGNSLGDAGGLTQSGFWGHSSQALMGDGVITRNRQGTLLGGEIEPSPHTP